MAGHRSHRGAVKRCCPGQVMGSGNETSTHSRGTRPAVPLQLGLTLKRIRLVLPVCVFVHLMGLHWAASLHAFPHQTACSSNKAIIQMLIQTCTSC